MLQSGVVLHLATISVQSIDITKNLNRGRVNDQESLAPRSRQKCQPVCAVERYSLETRGLYAVAVSN